jgi:hypothetical protein
LDVNLWTLNPWTVTEAYIPDKRFLCKERHHASWVSPPRADQPNLLDKFLGDSLRIDILPAWVCRRSSGVTYGATPVQSCSQFFEVSCTEAQQIIWIEIAQI